MSHIRIIAVLLTLSLQASIVFAGEVIQGRVGIYHSENEDSDNDTEKRTNINLEYYFTPVEKKSHPWREAAFLERASSLELEFGKNTQEFEGSEKYDGPAYSIGGTYASKTNPLIASFVYQNEEVSANLDFWGTVKREISGIGIALGAYVSSSMALQAIYLDSDAKYSYENASQLDFTDDVVLYGLQAKYVHELAQQQALNLELSAVQIDFDPENRSSESNSSVDFSATYYFNPKIGLSGTLSLRSGDTDSYKGTEYGVGLDAFVTEDFALTVGYVNFESDSSNGVDEDGWSVGVDLLF